MRRLTTHSLAPPSLTFGSLSPVSYSAVYVIPERSRICDPLPAIDPEVGFSKNKVRHNQPINLLAACCSLLGIIWSKTDKCYHTIEDVGNITLKPHFLTTIKPLNRSIVATMRRIWKRTSASWNNLVLLSRWCWCFLLHSIQEGARSSVAKFKLINYVALRTYVRTYFLGQTRTDHRPYLCYRSYGFNCVRAEALLTALCEAI